MSTSSFPIERPLYRVNIWHEPAPGYAWNLEAWHLYDARDIFEVIEWVADHNKGRPYEVFVTNDDEAETEFAIRLIGADPNSRTSDR
ncbi:hypothetical protein [Microbacterium sp. CIAB417]|uniref:hypothetical protein n=1 Tax=Microbacterium sp. CIAB417 TaxID=2860287 RepID=UPI001FAD3CE4|nr:hypothetical protein [Microbacterium sp. CIAB417]